MRALSIPAASIRLEPFDSITVREGHGDRRSILTVIFIAPGIPNLAWNLLRLVS